MCGQYNTDYSKINVKLLVEKYDWGGFAFSGMFNSFCGGKLKSKAVEIN
jgi:hypothetical protein